jgi:hypothetical protein
MRPEESPWIEAVVLSDRLQDVITGDVRLRLLKASASGLGCACTTGLPCIHCMQRHDVSWRKNRYGVVIVSSEGG